MKMTILLAVALVVSGCATKPRYTSIDDFPLSHLSSLQRKSQKEVQSILGTPTGRLTYAKGTVWEYQGLTQFITVSFSRSSPTIATFVTSGKNKEEAYREYVQTTETEVLSPEEIKQFEKLFNSEPSVGGDGKPAPQP